MVLFFALFPVESPEKNGNAYGGKPTANALRRLLAFAVLSLRIFVATCIFYLLRFRFSHYRYAPALYVSFYFSFRVVFLFFKRVEKKEKIKHVEN